MTSTLNLADITTTTTQTYKDVSCNSLIVDGITVNKSTYDDGEYLVTNQFSYDSTNPQNVTLKAGTTMNMDMLLLDVQNFPTVVSIDGITQPQSEDDVGPVSSSTASVLNGFTQYIDTSAAFAKVTCVTPGDYVVTFIFTASQNQLTTEGSIQLISISSTGSELIAAEVSNTVDGIEYTMKYYAYIGTGESLLVYINSSFLSDDTKLGISNGTLTISKSTPFSSISTNSVRATPNNNSLFTLDSSVTGLTIGNNSLYISPSNKAIGINRSTIESGYKLAVNGGLNGNGNAIEVALTGDTNMEFYSTSTSSSPPSTWNGLSANATSGSTINWYFGKDNSNYNHGRLRFGYTGSANSGNYIGMGLAGGSSMSIYTGNETYCASAYLDTSNSSKITFHRIVQTNPNIMALRLSNGTYTYTNASAILFNSIDSRLDNGTTGTTTLINTNLGISYSTTTGQFTFTSSTTRYYHISWQIAFNTVENSGYSIEGQIQVNNNASYKIIGNRTELPYTLISGVLSSVCASGLLIGSTTNANFKLIPSAIDDAGTAVTSPNSVTITNLNCTSIVITEL